jgi:hypothetical protein
MKPTSDSCFVRQTGHDGTSHGARQVPEQEASAQVQIFQEQDANGVGIHVWEIAFIKIGTTSVWKLTEKLRTRIV